MDYVDIKIHTKDSKPLNWMCKVSCTLEASLAVRDLLQLDYLPDSAYILDHNKKVIRIDVYTDYIVSDQSQNSIFLEV